MILKKIIHQFPLFYIPSTEFLKVSSEISLHPIFSVSFFSVLSIVMPICFFKSTDIFCFTFFDKRVEMTLKSHIQETPHKSMLVKIYDFISFLQFNLQINACVCHMMY